MTKMKPVAFEKAGDLNSWVVQRPDNSIQWISDYPEYKIFSSLNVGRGCRTRPYLNVLTHRYVGNYTEIVADCDC